ncbi:TonB family protein, partial [Coprobacter fastidiosus]
MNKKQPVYFVNDTYVDSEDFEDMQILEDIVSIDVIKDADKNPQLKKLFDKYGKNAGLIFVRLRPGIDIKGVIGPDGKRLESERLPEFPGGKTAMFNFIEKNKKFPFALLDKGIENGSAQVTFVVKSDGTLSDIKVTKSTAPELAKEAIRVISNMPKWIPGKKRGIPSDYTRTVNIDFRGIIIR